MVQILTGPRLARAFRAGALAVVREQESLNRINVFPVPDADTGNNLASTLRSAAAALTVSHGITVGQTARTAADAALDGARGNSGAILAQFLHGLAEAIGSRVHVTTNDFAAAVDHGVESAHLAMQQPVEGTILTVLRAWAAALQEYARSVHDFGDLLGHALERARQALADTPKQLAVLAKHGVVDAGAQGFVYFLEGISSLFSDRAAADFRKAGLTLAVATPFAAAHAEFDPTYRFCAEGLITGELLDRKAIGRQVATLGGSVVVAGGGSRLRVHVHTNEPQRLFAMLATFGNLERTKTDDMVLQQLAARDARVALVSDSGADLPEAAAHALGLVKVPLNLSFGDESFVDGVDITPAQFYQRLATSPHHPKTSQPAVGDFKATYRRLLEHHESVLSVHITGGMSGTFQNALAAARQVDPERIRVVDTKHLSVTLGLVLEAVGEARRAGASLDTALKGGRVSPSMARFARLFGLNPMLTTDEAGKSAKAGIYFGYQASLRGLAARAARFAGGAPVRLLIAHANAVGAAEYVAELLCRRFGVTDIPIVNLAAVLAAHTGPGTVGLAVRRLEA